MAHSAQLRVEGRGPRVKLQRRRAVAMRADDDVIASQNFPLGHDCGATASAQPKLPLLQRYSGGPQWGQAAKLGIYPDGPAIGQETHKCDNTT